jgi:hypothetical protein
MSAAARVNQTMPTVAQQQFIDAYELHRATVFAHGNRKTGPD